MPSFSARSEWKIGGMTDANGFLDHPVVANGYFAPDEVRLEGELISWSGLVSERHPGKSVLERFVRLDNKEPAAIAAFVQKWGPLNVADYLRRFLGGTLTVTAPQHRLSAENLVEYAESFLGCKFPDGLGNSEREPISVYRGVAAFLRRLLSNAAEIYSGQLSQRDWLARYPYHCETCLCGFDRALDNVERPVQRLLQIGQVSFTLEWAEDRWQIRISYMGLLGALAVQTMMVVTRSDGLYTCTGCGDPYIRSAKVKEIDGRIRVRRRPKPGQNNYCPRCGKRAATQDAKIRYRQKVREAKHLFESGMSISRIAKQLDADIKSVEKWIG